MMKRIFSIVLSLALFVSVVPCTFAFAETAEVVTADDTELSKKYYVVGEIATPSTLSPLANGTSYEYSSWVRDIFVDPSGVGSQNLALSARIFYMDTEDPDSNAFIEQNTGYVFLSDTFNASGDGQKILWNVKTLKCADGSDLKPGVWNDILLPFNTADENPTFDVENRDITFFWWRNLTIPNDHHDVRLEDVKIVDMSREVRDLMNNYVIGKIATPSTLSPLANGTSYEYSSWVRDIFVDPSGVESQNLALSARFFYMDTEDPDSNAFIEQNTGYVFLSDTFNGTEGGQKILWNIKTLKCADGSDLKPGVWNDILLPFNTADENPTFDVENRDITFFWWRNLGVPNNHHDVRLEDVKIVDTSREARDPMDNYVLGEIATPSTLPALGSGTNYEYSSWVRDIFVDPSGVGSQNLALSARLFYMDTEDPDSNAFIEQNTGYVFLSDTFNGENGGEKIQWNIKTLKCADGSDLKPGVWNDILLPFNTADENPTFDVENRDITFFWWRNLTIPNGHHDVRLEDVKIVDTSRAGVESEGPELGCTHENVTTVTVDADCVNAGSITVTCDDCGEVISTEVIAALGHTPVADEGIAPDCINTGLSAGAHCGVCGEVLTAQEVIDALGHTEVIDEAVAPTCTETGLTAGSHCSVCGEVIVAQEVVDALGHDDGVLEGAVDATVAAPGYTGDLVCGVCGEILEKGEVIPALEAKLVDGVYYVDGKRAYYAGLVAFEGEVYYVDAGARVVKGRYFISNTNGIEGFAKGYYYFDENGALVTENGVYDGFYYEGGKAVSYAGAVEANGAVYYVQVNGALQKGRYAISKGNGILANGFYFFDENGAVKKNVVEGGFYYGATGHCVAYCGIVEVDGAFYYVNDNGAVVKNNAKFYVTKTNGLVTRGFHAFDADGKMIVD